MKINIHFATFFLTLGFLLISNVGYACAMKVEKANCHKENSSKTEKKDCCNTKQSNKKHKGCSGKCGHSNCTTSVPIFSFIQNNDVKFISNIFDFSIERQKFYYNQTRTSNGFFSLWLIPKIG
ncbi:hypothetical protein [Flavobacterium sp.]|uniref:hypothetical protein n=1 Tax=Flavobacterium sp. TaxID=239 RepID=UPI00286D06CE|nr:hypothetical protein [Flavobacterium sp.]